MENFLCSHTVCFEQECEESPTSVDGFKCQLSILKFQFSTDLRMYSRRGYDNSRMNTNDLVWNASLAHSFMKGHLTATLNGFDLLQQLKNFTYSVNGQGYIESWHRSVPSYVMLHLMYKFHINPKKKL